MIESIKITDVHVASQIALNNQDNNYTHWITLMGPSDEHVISRIKESFKDKGVGHFHRYFEDIEDGPYLERHGPNKEDVEHIIELFKNLKNDNISHNVGINCMAGVSRSTAAGIIGWMVNGDCPEIALRKILKIRAFAHPNIHMIKLYDEIMGTKAYEFIKDWKGQSKPLW